MPRIIAHLDMDAFFASIEERDKPRLKGLAIVVGSDPKEGHGRGVVSTANYKAREYGIKSALPISTAWKFAQEAEKSGLPKTIFISPNFSKYEKASQEIIKIIRKYSQIVEPASIDEAYFDLSIYKSFNKAKNICRKIKKEIQTEIKVTCSIGIGPNKLIAKIASDMQKPNGLTLVEEKNIQIFLDPLPIRKIPGIGPKTEIELKKIKIEKIKDVKAFSQNELMRLFGKSGRDIYEKARGIDDSPLVESWQAKSIGEQHTLEADTLDPQILSALIKELAADVHKRFENDGFASYKTIGITVRFQGFETKTRSHTLKEPENSKSILEFEALKLFLPFLDKRENPQHKKIRLLGVKVEHMEKSQI